MRSKLNREFWRNAGTVVMAVTSIGLLIACMRIANPLP